MNYFKNLVQYNLNPFTKTNVSDSYVIDLKESLNISGVFKFEEKNLNLTRLIKFNR